MHNANEVFNHLPRDNTKATPFSIMFHRPSKICFHEFGSEVYVLNTNQKQKLDEKSEIMRYLGNDKQSKGFRVYSKTGKIQISRDVKFIKQLKFTNDVEFGQENPENDSEDLDCVSSVKSNEDEMKSEKSDQDSIISINDTLLEND